LKLRRSEQGQTGRAEQGCIALLPVEQFAKPSAKPPTAELRASERAVIVHHVGRTGVPVRIAVPFEHYKGICADIRYGQHGLECNVVLAHDNADYEVTLFSAQDDENILAEWNSWAKKLDMPLMIRTEHGDTMARPKFGALNVNGVSPRRARNMFLVRRPRFLRARLATELTPDLSIHEEREIIARD
jgi:hypothetical protein